MTFSHSFTSIFLLKFSLIFWHNWRSIYTMIISNFSSKVIVWIVFIDLNSRITLKKIIQRYQITWSWWRFSEIIRQGNFFLDKSIVSFEQRYVSSCWDQVSFRLIYLLTQGSHWHFQRNNSTIQTLCCIVWEAIFTNVIHRNSQLSKFLDELTTPSIFNLFSRKPRYL